jgi:hypothetical protein
LRRNQSPKLSRSTYLGGIETEVMDLMREVWTAVDGADASIRGALPKADVPGSFNLKLHAASRPLRPRCGCES